MSRSRGLNGVTGGSLPADIWRKFMEAATAGMGVAIARQTLISGELSSGELIAPFPLRVATGMHYGIVHAQGALDDRRVLAVHDWIVEEARRHQP